MNFTKKLYYFLLISIEISLFESKKIFLTDDYYPLTYCSYNDSSPESFKGIEVELFRETFTNMGWVEGKDYSFECRPYSKIIKEISSNSSLAGGFSGIGLTAENMRRGISFSQPTMETGLSFLTKDRSTDFFFLELFDELVLIIILLISPVFLSMVAYYLEGFKIEFRAIVFQLYTGFFFMKLFPTQKSLPVKLIYFIYSLVLIVIVSIYFARFVLFFTEKRRGESPDLASLRSQRVLNLNTYTDYLINLDAKPIPFDWSLSTLDIEKLFRNTKSVKYLATDDVVIQYLALRNCEMRNLQNLQISYKIKYSMAFGPDLSQSERKVLDQTLVSILGQKTYDERVKEFFLKENIRQCLGLNNFGFLYQMNISNLRSLWFILSGFIALGVIFCFLVYCVKRKCPRFFKKGPDKLDIRNSANHQIVNHTKNSFCLFLKANEVKISKHITKIYPPSREKLESFKKRRPPQNPPEAFTEYDAILRSNQEKFQKYISGQISLVNFIGKTSMKKELKKIKTETQVHYFMMDNMNDKITLDKLSDISISSVSKKNVHDYLENNPFQTPTKTNTWVQEDGKTKGGVLNKKNSAMEKEKENYDIVVEEIENPFQINPSKLTSIESPEFVLNKREQAVLFSENYTDRTITASNEQNEGIIFQKLD